MPEYFLAASLVALRREVNRRWPNRDKASDGWIGDPSHQARRSDHNPDWDAPGARRGVVRALDVDKDGITVSQLLAAVVRDPRVAYVIWNRRIASATADGTPWNWEPYRGTNPHTSHVHISIKHTATAEAGTSPWFADPEDDMTPQQAAQLNAVYNQTRANARLMVSLSQNLTALIARELDDDADKDAALAALQRDVDAVQAALAAQ
jgi:hypothetical protein